MSVLLALVALVLAVALVCLAGVVLTVVPFVVGVDMAERRAYSPSRWGAVCAAGPLLGLAGAYLVHSHHASRVLYLPALALAWAAPGLLSLLTPGQGIGGPQGAHER